MVKATISALTKLITSSLNITLIVLTVKLNVEYKTLIFILHQIYH